MVILFVTTMAYGAVHQAILAIAYILIGIIVTLWVADALKRGELTIDRSYLQLPLLAAGIYGIIQVIPFSTVTIGGVDGISRTITLDPFVTKVSAMHFFALLAYFSLLLTYLNSAARLRKIAAFIGLFGFGYAFFAILQSILSPTSIYGIYERPFLQPFGSFVSRNNFAAWMEMAIAIPLAALLLGNVKKDRRLLYITAVALMGISLVASGSRGGLVVLLVEIILLLFISLAQKRGKLGLRILLASGLIAVIVAGTAFVGIESSLTRITDQEQGAPDSASRPKMWGNAIKIIGDNMPFGVGLGAFGTAYTRYDESSGMERVEQAHNDFLQVLSDGGIVGGVIGIAFLILFIQTGRQALKVSNDQRRALAAGAFAGTFGVLVHSLFDFVLHTTAIALLFLTLLAILIRSKEEYADDAPNEPEERERRRSRKRIVAS